MVLETGGALGMPNFGTRILQMFLLIKEIFRGRGFHSSHSHLCLQSNWSEIESSIGHVMNDFSQLLQMSDFFLLQSSCSCVRIDLSILCNAQLFTVQFPNCGFLHVL